MQRVSLDIANWVVRAVGDISAVPAALRGQSVPARVPGCVHTDLIRAGLIPDPLVGTNEREVQWIGETDWEYRANFEADAELLAHERVDLACYGLDTIAEVRVNGIEIGRAANMFHPHRFDLRGAARGGQNEISIMFRSPLKHIRAKEARLGKRPVNGDWDPYIFIRKAACNFGWDWAPKLATCGIWRSIGVEAWDRARTVAVRPATRRGADGAWTLEVNVDLEWSENPASGGVLVGGQVEHDNKGATDGSETEPVMPGTLSVRRCWAFPNVEVWWPRGMGNQALYGLETWISEAPDGFQLIERRDWHFGFREIKLKQPADLGGGGLRLEVNGRDVFCKGANWIPEGPWPVQSLRSTAIRLHQAAAANVNMLRVWGGGYYESNDFYAMCSGLGIMVWQDFMFACAMYPEEDPYPKLIEAEARHQIARLSSHPSVVLWCGGNECVWAHEAWGNAPGERPWKERLEGKTWGAGYYFDLLPRLVKELDPTRPYWPNSPWTGEIANPQSAIPQNSPDRGDRHTWDLRGEAYRKIIPRFCSEFGHQSPSNYATLAKVLSPEDLKLGSPALEHRQRGTGGTKRHIDDAIAELFRPPRDFDEWHYLAQLTQARAIKTGIEWLRVNRPRCMGALIWQFNDCWPGMSWSLIDSDGRCKPAYHAAAASFRDRLVTIQPFDGRPWLCVVNDKDQPGEFDIEVRRVRFDGQVAASTRVREQVPPASVARLLDLEAALGPASDPTQELLFAKTAGQRATWFYLPDHQLSYPVPKFKLAPHEGHDGIFLRVEAQSLLRDVLIAARPDAGFVEPPANPSLVTLLPGEAWDYYWGDCGAPNSVTFRLWSANQFGAGA